MNDIEPRTHKSLQSKTWNAAQPKFKKKSWEFQKAKSRGQLPELSSVIKPITFGSKIYKIGPYEGSLEDIRSYAKIVGIKTLKNGCISYKI